MTITLTTLFSIGILATLLSGVITLISSRFNTIAQVVLMMGSVLMGYVGVSVLMSGEMLVLPAFFALKAFEAYFVLIIALGTFLTSLFACGYLPLYAHEFPARRVNFAMGVFVVGMYGVVLATSLPVFLVMWELMSIAAYFLIVVDRSETSLAAGQFYFIMTHIGLSCLLAGFGLLAQGNFLSSWEVLRENATALSYPALVSALLFLFAGFGSKAGLIPLHGWLPHAHPQAPSHASALLSGVMLPVAFFGFIRVLQVSPEVPHVVSLIMLVAALLSAVFGALYAAVENDAKKLLAYSSIEHMGLLFSALASLIILQTVGYVVGPVITGLIFFMGIHILNHFFFKVGLFLSYGAVAAQTHTRDLDEMGGLAEKWPLFSAVVLALSIAAAALPPSGAFLGEWAYLQSLAVALMTFPPLVISLGILAVLSVVALSAGLALFAAIKMFSIAFLGRARTEKVAHVTPLPWLLIVSPLLCAVGVFSTAFLASPLLSGEMNGTIAFAEGVSLDMWLVGGTLLLILLSLHLIRVITSRGVRVTDTWDCGAPLTPRMQYTSTGFAAPIRFFFRSLLATKKRMHVEPVVATNTWIARRTLTWETGSIWEQTLYAYTLSALHTVARWMRVIQHGVIQLYILAVIVTLIITIIVAV